MIAAPMPAHDSLTYSSYLRLAALLAQQRPRSSPAAHDELMFITVHQAYELWFKLLLFELTDARDQLLGGGTLAARNRLERCRVIDHMLPGYFDVLDTMAAPDFRAFRGTLGTASGAQSAQFLEIEYLSGPRDPGPPRHVGRFTGAETMRLRRRLAEPTVWDGFITALGKTGFEVSSHEHRLAAYLEIAGNREQYAALWDLIEALVDHDQAWSMWRARHALTVERQIGARQGSGGSAGAAYLNLHRQRRFYPELWELRTLL
jgi:tryptophan 2,3-dioxygenase